jgi:hypothetical protein
MTATVTKIPTSIPVLNIPPITLHEFTINIRNRTKIAGKNFKVFMARNISDIKNKIVIKLNNSLHYKDGAFARSKRYTIL